MKKALDLAVFLIGVLIITIALFTAVGNHSEVVKIELHEIQPPGTQGT